MSLKWRIGNAEIFQIIEIENAGEIIQSIIPEATPQNIQKIDWLQPNFADADGHLKAQVQAFLIKSDGRWILVDACNGNGKQRTDMSEWGNLQTNFLEKLHELGARETDISTMICTHLHCDHVGWNTIMIGGKWVPTFPNAEYIFVKKEYDYWSTVPVGEIGDDLAAFDDSVAPIVQAGLAKMVDDNFRVDENIYLIPTPGHTPGHVGVAIESGGKKAIITGDLFHHPCQIAFPNWSAETSAAKEQAIASREKLLNEIADRNVLLIGSHFSDPVAGFVERKNDNYKLIKEKKR